GTMRIKVPFSCNDLKEWKAAAQEYRSDPVSVTQNLKFIIKQHNPDWDDMQLLLECLTEREKQLVIKTAGDLAKDHFEAKGEDVKDYFPLQDPKWDPNQSAAVERLQSYQGWILKGMERAIPKTINWAVLYAVKQGPSESPSEFLD
ncbi:hypothetical protein N340_14119, partial [Tauraco erythrolophus]